MSPRARMTLIGMGASLLFVAFVPGLAPDAEDAGDSDIALQSVPKLPPAANAYSELIDLSISLRLSDEQRKAVVDCRKEPACLGEKLGVGLTPADLARLEAFRLKDFQSPATADVSRLDPSEKLPPMHVLLQAADLALIAGRRERARGRPVQALESSLRLAEAAQRLQASAGLSIEYFTGSILKLKALDEIRRAAAAGVPKSAALAASSRVAALRGSEDGWRRALRSEYMVMAQTLRQIDSRKSLARRLVYKPNRTRRLYAEWFRGVIGRAGSCDVRPAVPASGTLRLVLDSLRDGNLAGRLMNERIAKPDFDRHSIRLCEERFFVAATQVALASAAFNAQRRRPPATPAELVPAYLPALPVDPYAGGPLRYSEATGSLIAGGKGADGEDLVVNLR